MTKKFSQREYVVEAKTRFHYATMKDFLVAAHCHKYGLDNFDEQVVNDAAADLEKPNAKIPDFALRFARHLRGEGDKKRIERERARQPAMANAA